MDHHRYTEITDALEGLTFYARDTYLLSLPDGEYMDYILQAPPKSPDQQEQEDKEDMMDAVIVLVILTMVVAIFWWYA